MAAELAAFQAVATTYGLNKAQAATYFVAVILSTDPTSLGLSTDPNPSNPGGLSDAQTYVNQFNAATNRAIVSGNFANQSATASNLNYPVVGPATNNGYKGAVNSEIGVSNLTSTVVTAEGQIAVAAAANNPALITGQNIPTTTYNLTTGIDTIPSSGVISPNATVNGVQQTLDSTWNTGDTINGDGTTVISLIANGGTASIVNASKIASLNINAVADTPLNATQWSDVVKVSVNNGIAGTNTTISAAKLASTYSLEAAGINNTLTIGSWTSATGSSDTAKLSVAGTGNKTTGSFFTIGNANDIEAVTLATSGANFVTINAGTAATKFTSTGSGVNDITIGSASSGAKTIDFSGSSGTNKIRLGTLMNSADVITGGTGVDKVYATFGTAVTLNPTITAVETVALTYNAAGSFNASKWTGGTGLQITPTTGVTAAVTNLNASVAAINIGESSAIAATGDAINIGYATGSKSDVTLSVGATSTSSDPAVSSTGTITFTNNAGSLNVKSVGDAANTLGNITANKASALTVSAPGQGLTTGDLSATSATSITIDASANDVTTTNIAAQSTLATLTVKADVGAVVVGDLSAFVAKAATDVDLTTNLTSGANTATLGFIDITGAANHNAALTVNVTTGDAAASISTVNLTGGLGDASGAVTVTFNEAVTSGIGAVTLGDTTVALGVGLAGYEGTLNANVALVSGTGAITAGAPNYTFDSGTGADNNGLDVTFSATTGIGAITLGNITAVGGENSASTLSFTGTTSGNGALTTGIISLKAEADASTSTVTLDASKANILVSAIDIESVNVGTTVSGVLSLSSASGRTLTVTDLTSSGGGTEGFASITASGAGAVVLDADGTGAFGALATSVDTTGLTGGFTLNATTGSGSITVNLGNAASGKTNTVTTGSGADTINGGSGNDVLTGGSGNDTIAAGNGTNTIVGGSGADTMSGGSGVDTYGAGSNFGAAGTSIVASANTLSATIAAGDTLTFGSGVDIVTNFGTTDKLDVVTASSVGTNLVGSLKTLDLVTGTTYYAYGSYNSGTGVFTIASAFDATTAHDALVVVGDAGALTPITTTGYQVMEGLTAALTTSNFI